LSSFSHLSGDEAVHYETISAQFTNYLPDDGCLADTGNTGD